MRVSLEKIAEKLPDIDPDNIPYLVSGLVDENHYVTVLTDKHGKIWDVILELDISKLETQYSIRATANRLDVPDLSVFGFYQEQAMEALKRIGEPLHSISFEIYETIGTSVANVDSLARINF
jgi:hypothetical protein